MREGGESSAIVLADEVVALFVIDDNEERRTVRVISAQGLEQLRHENPGHEYTFRALIRAQKRALDKERKLGSRHLPVVYFSGEHGLPRERFDTCEIAVFVADIERMRSWLDGPTTS